MGRLEEQKEKKENEKTQGKGSKCMLLGVITAARHPEAAQGQEAACTVMHVERMRFAYNSCSPGR